MSISLRTSSRENMVSDISAVQKPTFCNTRYSDDTEIENKDLFTPEHREYYTNAGTINLIYFFFSLFLLLYKIRMYQENRRKND